MPLSLRVAAQQEYGAYGEVVWAEHLLNHPALHLGHKGLFVDRLDVGISEELVLGGAVSAAAKTFNERPRIVPLAFNLAQNRNRTLHVGMQRYLQLDPNASGAAVLAEQAYGASSLGTGVDGLRLLGQFGDGANLYQYVMAQPTRRGDPMGLYSWEDAGEDAMDIMGMLDPIPGPGDYIQGELKGMVQEYAARQEWDVDWASNWNMSDDMHSRNDSSWVTIAALEGVKDEFTVNLPFSDLSVNPLDTGIGIMAAAAMSGDGGGSRGYDPGKGPGAPLADAKGVQEHHIASNKGDYGPKFKEIFARAGKDLDWRENRMRVPHQGRHPKDYHEFVRLRLDQATEGLGRAEAEEALKSELRKIRKFVKQNPNFLYDNAKGRATGWRGMRQVFATPLVNKIRKR